MAWLNRQHIQITCERQCSPAAWIAAVLEQAKGKSGGKVEQHLVGAKLEKRHPELPIPNFPGHAGDHQTKRNGDFILGTTCFHVTSAPAGALLAKCAQNLNMGLHPVILVPRSSVAKTRHLAEDAGIEPKITIIGLEDFIAANIIELSLGDYTRFLGVLQEIVSIYNRRLEQVETDLSLKIDLK